MKSKNAMNALDNFKYIYREIKMRERERERERERKRVRDETSVKTDRTTVPKPSKQRQN